MTDIPRDTVAERVRFPYRYECYKHQLAPNCEMHADGKINQMTNTELLDAISEAIEERKGDEL